MNNIGLAEFTIKTLNETDSCGYYIHSWHIELMCNYLERLYKNEFNRLIINIPPRSLKSICVSVAFPAWILANRPNEKIIAVSYSHALSIKHSVDCRNILQSDWYQKICETRISHGNNEKRKFITTKGGYRFATSIKGTLTGEGGNVIIIDDPQSPLKIYKKSERDMVNNWFESTLMSRLNDKKNGKIILVMQRLHPEDLTSYLESKGSHWKILKIPMIADIAMRYIFDNKISFFRKKSDILQPLINTKSYIDELLLNMGNNTFYAQYQQDPKQISGIINTNIIQNFDTTPESGLNYLSIDTALGKEFSDYTVIMHILVYKDLFYIINIIREKMDYTNLKEKIFSIIKSINLSGILIEDRNFGSSIISEFKDKNLPVFAINPKNSKVTRMLSVIGILEMKKLFINRNSKLAQDFLTELEAFPNAKNDDQVDCLSQFLNWYSLYNKGLPNTNTSKHPRIRSI